jgi:hypothetical protein
MDNYTKDQEWQGKNLYKQLGQYVEQAFKNVADLSGLDYKQPNTATTVNKLVEIFVKRGRV